MFSYWMITTKLLKEGIGWEAIQKLTTSEITMLLATLAAFNEEDQDAQTRSMAQF